MAGRPLLSRHSRGWTTEGALRSAARPGPPRDRAVGGSALRSDQSPQPPVHIGPSRPGARPAGAASSPEPAGGPGPGRVSVPSSREGLWCAIELFPPGEGRSPAGSEGRRGPRTWQPLPAAKELPQLWPRRSPEPLGSPVTSPPDYALTRLQPHFLGGGGGGGETPAQEGEGRPRGCAAEERAPPGPAHHPSPPVPSALRPPPWQVAPPTLARPSPTPTLPPARPPPGVAVPTLCSRPAQDAGRREGRGPARAGELGWGGGAGGGRRGGEGAGLPRVPPPRRPRPRRLPGAASRPVQSRSRRGQARALARPPSAVVGPRHGQPAAARPSPAAATAAAPGRGRARPAPRRRDVPGARAGAAGGGGERGAHRHRGGDSQRGPGAAHVLVQGAPPPGPLALAPESPSWKPGLGASSSASLRP